jgi:hypothetical protein
LNANDADFFVKIRVLRVQKKLEIL